jgi:hypothetical protein
VYERKRPNKASELVDVARAEIIELFHTPDGDAHATIAVGDHVETHALRTKPFKSWLSKRCYDKTGAAAGAQRIQDALAVLEGEALYSGREAPVFVRLAEHNGPIYLDLTDSNWRAVEITASGWRVIDDPPVKFRRSRGMLPLPEPACGGSVALLRKYINVTDSEWPLFVAVLLASLWPRGPFAITFLHGEQGSAKSTAAKVFRRLVDPNVAPLRSEPREPRDLAIAARNGWVVMLDNLSKMSVWFSDALCRLATGGGFATRELYSDFDEVLFDAMRPAVITSIEEIAHRSDVLDRSVVLTLGPIAEDQRQPEDEFWAEFDREAPAILGALLDALVVTMQRLPTVTLGWLPRMADFAKLFTAAEPALGFPAGTIMAAYLANRARANDQAIEGLRVGPAILSFAASLANPGDTWTGTAGDLLEALNCREPDDIRKRKDWPSSPRALAGALRRLAPNLRKAGIEIIVGEREAGGQRRRLTTLTRVGGAPSRPSQSSLDPVQTGGEPGRSGDGSGAVGQPARPAETPVGVSVRDARDGRDDDSPGLFTVGCSWGAPAGESQVGTPRPAVAQSPP